MSRYQLYLQGNLKTCSVYLLITQPANCIFPYAAPYYLVWCNTKLNSSLCKVFYFLPILSKQKLRRNMSVKSTSINFHKNPSGLRLYLPQGWKEMTKLIVAFLNFLRKRTKTNWTDWIDILLWYNRVLFLIWRSMVKRLQIFIETDTSCRFRKIRYQQYLEWFTSSHHA
jgi:hypothetical protein